MEQIFILFLLCWLMKHNTYGDMMKLLVIVWVLISSHLRAADKIPSLAYQINTVENLGTNLAVPVIYGGFIFAKSCSERCIAIIDIASSQIIRSIDLHLEPSIHEFSNNIKIIELNDGIILLLNEISQELVIIHGGKHQHSPRLVPVDINIGSYNFIYTFEQGRLSLEITNQKTTASIAKAVISQRSYLCAKNLEGQTMPVVINEKLLACSNWSNHSVSIIDHSSHQVIKQIPVGRYPIKPVVFANKLYVSNFGDGSISIIELLAD